MTTSVIAAFGERPPEDAIGLAVKALSGGDIIGLPTDTVYGLAADPFHTGASDRLFRLKGRPRSVELPVLVASEAQALALCTAVPASARRLMRRYLARAAHPRIAPPAGPGGRPRRGRRHYWHPLPGPPGTPGRLRADRPYCHHQRQPAQGTGTDDGQSGIGSTRSRARAGPRRRGVQRLAVDCRRLHGRGAEGTAGGHAVQRGDRGRAGLTARGPTSGPVLTGGLPAGTRVPDRRNGAGHYARR